MLALQTGIDSKVIQFGTEEEIVERIKHYMLVGKNGSTPCIFFHNNIAPDTPLENIMTAMQAVEIYGAPGADENTPYVRPEHPTFEEFLKEKIANNELGYTFDWLKKSGYAHLAG